MYVEVYELPISGERRVAINFGVGAGSHAMSPDDARKLVDHLQHVLRLLKQAPAPIRHVYIAGPYTLTDQAVNVRLAIDAADALLDAGMCPYVPHLSHFWHMLHPHDYTDWMELDNAWLRRCDALLRLPGYSSGADAEVKEAIRLGIPVFYDVPTLLSKCANQTEREVSDGPSH